MITASKTHIPDRGVSGKYGSHVAGKLLAAFFIVAMTVACNDGGLDVPGPGFDVFKVYNDTMANAQNPIMWIASGNGRLFMTYGSSSFGQHVNGSFDVQNMKSRVMATDNQGNLLWRRDLPVAMDQAVVVGLDDGGCLVATKFSWGGENPEFQNEDVYLFRYDQNGNIIKRDSLSLVPVVSDYGFVSYLNAYKSPNGRIIIHGDCSYQSSGSNGSKGFAFEYNPETGLKWIRDYAIISPGLATSNMYVNGCVQTDDNGFLFFGTVSEYDAAFNYYANPVLIKTNASGDTLWTKRFGGIQSAYLWDRNIVATSKGNYRFSFNAIHTGYDSCDTYIYEVNAAGDSVTSVVVDNEPLNVVSMLVPTDDGGCMALLNQSTTNAINDNSGSTFRQVNTRLLRFNGGLAKTSDKTFQALTTDYLVVACRTSDGRIACFGMQQQFGKTWYLPHLYIMK